MGLLSTVIPSYAYRQFAGDDDIAAMIAAFNAASAYYLSWFQSVNLAYYPGLSGDLLDWVAEGVYGNFRTSLASALNPSVGTPGTQMPGSILPGNFSPPTQTLYSLTDDAFQRIITWNFYKGDGKRFSMRWLKRRIMRFLLGVNGTDPQGGINAAVGTENTQAISVTVASNVLTVSINQVLLSKVAQLTPGILQIFQVAFEDGQAGPLELPLQYESFVCNIVTSLQATADPSTLTQAGAATTQTTATSDIVVLGGSGSYTYAHSWLSGGSGITANPSGSPSGSVVDFTATGMTPGDTYTGIDQCLVTDTVSSDTTTCQISVSIQCYAALSASISPSTASGTGATSSINSNSVTANISGGSGSYSVSWAFTSGGAGIDINSPAAVTTNFTATGLSPGGSESGIATCTVTDTVTGDKVYPTCSVSISRVTVPTATYSPSGGCSSTGTATTQTTNAVTTTTTGGQSPYSSAWSWYSGGSGLGINSPASASTTVTGAGMTPGNTYTGVMQYVATDAYGQTSAPIHVNVSITCLNPTYTGTLVAGLYTDGSDNTFIGYDPGESIGSLSPTSDYYGHTIDGIYTTIPASGSETFSLAIGGFSSDPLQSYFATIGITGNATLSASSAYNYSYSDGTALWQWTSSLPSLTSGDPYTITIDYV